MDPNFNHEWTFSEIEEARSIIARLNNHENIIDQLHAWFPHKTMQQVIDLYFDLVVDMQLQKDSSSVGGIMQDMTTFVELENDNFGVPQDVGGNVGTNNIFTMVDFVNNKFMMPKEMAASTCSSALGFGCPPTDMGIMEIQQEPQLVDKNKVEVLEDKVIDVNKQGPTPYPGRFWSTDEHKLFLRGLQFYGRGKWKNISKYYVKTRTPLQVSSHAQKYFKRLERKPSSTRQRYSINDVRLDNSDPLMFGNNSKAWHPLSFAGSNKDPNIGQNHLITSSVAKDDSAPFWSPFHYHQQASEHRSWTGHQMTVPTSSHELWSCWSTRINL